MENVLYVVKSKIKEDNLAFQSMDSRILVGKLVSTFPSNILHSKSSADHNDRRCDKNQRINYIQAIIECATTNMALLLEQFQSPTKNTTPDDKTPTYVLNRFITSLTTFPLSLSYGVNKLFPAIDADLNNTDALRVLMIGCRSESSLPLAWWRETLYTNISAFRNVQVRMVGPGLCQLKERAETIRWEDAESSRESSIEFTSGHQADYNLLHAHPQSVQLLQWAHVFVLFNPGSGSPSLSARWDPTLRLLLETRKPVLCTAHGPHDLQRDIAALETIAEQEDGEVQPSLSSLSIHHHPFPIHFSSFFPPTGPAARRRIAHAAAAARQPIRLAEADHRRQGGSARPGRHREPLHIRLLRKVIGYTFRGYLLRCLQ
jgi:hypothetical protein